MNTIGWIFILVSILVVRAVAKGRALNIPQDLGDAFQAFVNGDYDSLSEVFNRTGDTSTVATGSLAAGTVGDSAGAAAGVAAGGAVGATGAQLLTNQNIAYWAYQLGRSAKGYRFGAAGPSYYDCSGLVYRAVQKVGYKGPRFFTATVAEMPGFQRVTQQIVAGDIVVWPGHHMGVVVGGNRFYSALNPRVGIREEDISGFRKGETPIYLRFVGGN